MTVVIGIDPHKASHTATAIGPGSVEAATIRLRAARSTPEELLSWAEQWPERRWGVEGARGLGQLLAQQLVAAGEHVVRRARNPLSAGADPRDRDTAARPTTSTPRAVALVAAQRPDLPRVTADDHCRVLRLLADRRDELTSERRRTINRLHRHLRDLIAGGAPTQLNAKEAAGLLAKVRPRDGVESERKQMARDLLVDVRRLDRAIAQNRRRCAAAVAASGTSLCDLAGISDVLAAKILGHIGDIGRFPSADRLASYAGTAPIEASSGDVMRHRLSATATANSTTPSTSPPTPRPSAPGPAATITSADATPATAATKPSDSSNDNSPKPSTAPSSPTPTAPAKTPRLDIEALSGHVRPTGRCAPRLGPGPTDHQ